VTARRRLIVAADDFGMSPGVNAGILRAHRDGILTETSLMVRGAAVAEAVALARATPSLGIGLHPTLGQGHCAAPPSESPVLVDAAGRFADDPVWTGMRYFFTPGARAQLRREITAQLDAFAATGLPLSHVDGHLTIHMHPVAVGVLVLVAVPVFVGVPVAVAVTVALAVPVGVPVGVKVGVSVSVAVAVTVAVAVPAPQALSLLGPHGRTFQHIADVRMTPCWTGLFAFDPPIDVGADARRWTQGPIVWAASNSSKPDRPRSPQCWVVHASPGWSREHIDLDSTGAARLLLQAFQDSVGQKLPMPIQSIFDGDLGDLLDLASHGLPGDDGKMPELAAKPAKMPRAKVRLNAARALGRCLEISQEQRFLHWQVAFPGVWREWSASERQGGFDAIIGNPPWDRMKYQEVEWFAARRSEVAKAQTAAQRKKLIDGLRRKQDPRVKDYEKAIWSAETAPPGDPPAGV
jgi:hypothetical protein